MNVVVLIACAAHVCKRVAPISKSYCYSHRRYDRLLLENCTVIFNHVINLRFVLFKEEKWRSKTL
jgi:hypothetical protein